jgi:hypothetical protein
VPPALPAPLNTLSSRWSLKAARCSPVTLSSALLSRSVRVRGVRVASVRVKPATRSPCTTPEKNVCPAI